MASDGFWCLLLASNCIQLLPTGSDGFRRLFRLLPSARSIWAMWLQLEPTEGVYDFSSLHANVAEAAARGWKVLLIASDGL